MSSVRMCDMPACGLIFSEASEDWSTETGSMMRTNPINGRREQVDVARDVCGSCNRDRMGSRPVPQIALPGVPDVKQ